MLSAPRQHLVSWQSLMHILHVNAGNLFGGIETLLVTLARQRSLCSEVEPHFALFFEGRHGDELREAGVTVHRLGKVRLSRPWTMLRARWRLRKLLSEYRFDAVITHGCWPHAIAAPEARRYGLPLVFWAHAIQDGRTWLERWAYRFPPNLVLANSCVTQRSVAANLFPSAASEVLYLPITPPDCSDRDAIRQEVRLELQTPDDAVVIVMASRLEPWKGHRLLLAALGRILPIPNWVCWIAGGAQRSEEGHYLTELRKLARNEGIADRIRFLGQRSDVGRLLVAADIHCQPNVEPEPFGIAFVEALYAGLPVVTTAFGGALEILRENTGLLVSPNDTASLAEGIGGFIRDPERRLRVRETGPARATQLCHPRSQMRKLEAILTKMVR